MAETGNDAPKKGARWPFVMLFLFMWAGMIGTTLNSDPIKFEFSVAIVFGLAAIVSSLCLTGFTSLVLVWYAISFVKAYYRRLRNG